MATASSFRVVIALALAALIAPLPAMADPSPAPTDAPVGTNGSPVQLLECIEAAPSGGGDGSDVQVAIPFEVVGSKTASAVKFQIEFLDAFGTVIQREFGIVRGTFSPGVRIDPARPALGTLSGAMQYLDNPGNAAFEIYVSNPRDVVNVSCGVLAVLFDDGSAWQFRN